MSTPKIDIKSRNEGIIAEIHRRGRWTDNIQRVADNYRLKVSTVKRIYYNEQDKTTETVAALRPAAEKRPSAERRPCMYTAAEMPRCYGAGCHNAGNCPAVQAMLAWRKADNVGDWR